MPSPISQHVVPWPEADAARYQAAGYWAGVPLGSLLRRAADRTPNAPALADPAAGVRLTHRELAERADASVSSRERPWAPPNSRGRNSKVTQPHRRFLGQP